MALPAVPEALTHTGRASVITRGLMAPLAAQAVATTAMDPATAMIPMVRPLVRGEAIPTALPIETRAPMVPLEPIMTATVAVRGTTMIPTDPLEILEEGVIHMALITRIEMTPRTGPATTGAMRMIPTVPPIETRARLMARRAVVMTILPPMGLTPAVVMMVILMVLLIDIRLHMVPAGVMAMMRTNTGRSPRISMEIGATLGSMVRRVSSDLTGFKEVKRKHSVPTQLFIS